MKYLVAIRQKKKNQVFEFKTKKEAQSYIKYCKEKGIEYAISKDGGVKMSEEIDDSDDVQILMEFRQENYDLWIEFLKERGQFDAWEEYRLNNEGE